MELAQEQGLSQWPCSESRGQGKGGDQFHSGCVYCTSPFIKILRASLVTGQFTKAIDLQMAFLRSTVCDTSGPLHILPRQSFSYMSQAVSFSCFGYQLKVALLERPSLSSTRSSPPTIPYCSTPLIHSFQVPQCITVHCLVCLPACYLSLSSMRPKRPICLPYHYNICARHMTETQKSFRKFQKFRKIWEIPA